MGFLIRISTPSFSSLRKEPPNGKENLFIWLVLLLLLLSASFAVYGEEQEKVFEAGESGVLITAPDEYRAIKGSVHYWDYGNRYFLGDGVVELDAYYSPLSESDYDLIDQEASKAKEEDDFETVDALYMQQQCCCFGFTE